MGEKTYRTRAQEELLNFLKTEPGRHYTAAEIREHFAGQDHPIGTATIYRQLERFVSEGCVRRYVVGPGTCACYAYAGDSQGTQHFHCRCDVCGRLIHLNCDELAEIRTHLLARHGFAWDSGKTVFYGVCDQCRKA